VGFPRRTGFQQFAGFGEAAVLNQFEDALPHHLGASHD
jgi:hypothetical protein